MTKGFNSFFGVQNKDEIGQLGTYIYPINKLTSTILYYLPICPPAPIPPVMIAEGADQAIQDKKLIIRLNTSYEKKIFTSVW